MIEKSSHENLKVIKDTFLDKSGIPESPQKQLQHC